jgi:HEAT repeat protein
MVRPLEGKEFWDQAIGLGALLERASSPDPLERWAAVFALGDVEDQRASDALGSLCDDADPLVSQAAAATLKRAERLTARRAVTRRESMSVVRRYAARVEARLAPERAKLLPLLDDERPLVRAAVARALGEMGDTRSTRRLSQLAVDDAYAAVRRSCAVALGHLADADASEALQELLEDEEAGVRSAAAVALGELCNTETAEVLGEVLLNDDDVSVRMSACEGLAGCACTVAQYGSKGQREFLFSEHALAALREAADRDLDEDVREAAAEVLLELDDLEETIGGGNATTPVL